MPQPAAALPDAVLSTATSSTDSPIAAGAVTVTPADADAVARAGAAVARYGVAAVLLAIGLLKFTAAEADGIRPLMESSPLLRWMYAVWSIQDASRVIGAIELLAALGIALRPVSSRAAVVGGALAVATFVVTLSFFATAPAVWDAVHGFPFLGGTGQFLVKDVVLLGASLWSLGEAKAASRRR
jgi:reactive chlorine resistance protein C